MINTGWTREFEPIIYIAIKYYSYLDPINFVYFGKWFSRTVLKIKFPIKLLFVQTGINMHFDGNIFVIFNQYLYK